MKFKQNLNCEYGLGWITVVPLINVALLLAVFVFLLPLFTSAARINVKLAKAVTSRIVKEDSMVVMITGENVIYFNNKIFTIKELGRELKEKNLQNRSFLIKSDRRASVGRVIDIWDLCRDLGIEKVNIATTQIIK
ncbi:MAG: biopolymer transporter ExbD [Candidatus Omnitrophica bacterium]|nr:biopolymer transporter ExbD [Candidatus Omnitrophota bacterium]